MGRVTKVAGADASIHLTDSMILNAFGLPVLVLDAENRVVMVNDAAQQFFLRSENAVMGRRLDDLVFADRRLGNLVSRARTHTGAMIDYDVAIRTQPIHARRVDLRAAAIADAPGCVAVVMEPRSIADQISLQQASKQASRAASGIASMLAHEVKNPLSGIRGAAQLMEDALPAEDASLAQLVIKETDRIAAILDQIEVLSDQRSAEKKRENIHHILDHVIAVAGSGLDKGVTLHAAFDPSLPNINANWNQLVQVFLNLVINASEAVPPEGGRIEVKTAYRHGRRIRMLDAEEPIDLPIEISIIDNGLGVRDALRESLFDPFISSIKNGKGLGLALVAKIISDHQGFVSFERIDNLTYFKALLPAWAEQKDGSR
ncbi:MAG: nitrogen regulation protein NR(II) [Sphingomonadales bacterium]